MSDLVLDTDQLVETGHALRGVATEFESANDRSDYVADHVGNHDLADKVRDFAHKWKITREEMLADIKELAEAASATGENFQQLDKDLAAAIEGEK
ncbi:hypothetical protein [Nocardioides acrostichi]|uniref:Excreted virulence factor EspC, type VII ESX diderm n=1 Tax=Nocardioides acrostichi TaxID=2784339 RepID=A0A930UV82_9ACTN|nr:hypothetical protein [Nocardioides acrostichi]MBF4161473.1 hypothetical protein [Nocardioides acrostichi]